MSRNSICSNISFLKKMSLKDTGLGKTFKNLTPMAISENDIQPSEFIILRTYKRLFDNKGYFLAVYEINCHCLGSHKAYSSVDHSGV